MDDWSRVRYYTVGNSDTVSVEPFRIVVESQGRRPSELKKLQVERVPLHSLDIQRRSSTDRLSCI